SLEQNVFGAARPRVVVITTPNAEFNTRYERLAGGRLRHPDHRFEWTRSEFGDWARSVAEQYGYQLRLAGIGDSDAQLGTPTQLAIFSRTDAGSALSTATGEAR
ncbi:MAG: 3' terminal RNA ribose 2'-O-methyltransferase Hen1, partial [Nakamurella sp.]